MTLPISLPYINPVMLSVGIFDIRWYSMAYVAGIILGWLYIKYLNKNLSNNNEQLDNQAIEAIPTYMVLSIILGGRLGYVLFYNPTYYWSNPLEVLHIWQGGMSFHGGLLGVIVGSYIFCRKYKFPFLRFCDFLAASSAIGLFFGRIANFINAELRGKPTDWQYGVIYPDENFARHASQLYEAISEGLVTFLIVSLFIFKFNSLQFKGRTTAIFLMCYAISRFVCEFFRLPDLQLGYLLGTDWFTMGQLLTLPLIITCVFLLLKSENT